MKTQVVGGIQGGNVTGNGERNAKYTAQPVCKKVDYQGNQIKQIEKWTNKVNKGDFCSEQCCPENEICCRC